ncbi:hypothetical protein ALC56_05433 [Trachymyrmex septentrionalis]|uniref:Uncharacterized protein n=1 Tax=Trachymyrmex septentrionalis TaxID=34720 RepID=A0A195FJA8_9HYME|nr:hypothetical protein ALC56_05433 [Trachymyrmex septentrionalis]
MKIIVSDLRTMMIFVRYALDQSVKNFYFIQELPFFSLFISNLPCSNLAGLTSIPIIRDAPDFLQPKIAARPTAPKPHTAQVLPGSTLAVFKAAP